jgi:hypothetical protein
MKFWKVRTSCIVRLAPCAQEREGAVRIARQGTIPTTCDTPQLLLTIGVGLMKGVIASNVAI